MAELDGIFLSGIFSVFLGKASFCRKERSERKLFSVYLNEGMNLNLPAIFKYDSFLNSTLIQPKFYLSRLLKRI